MSIFAGFLGCGFVIGLLLGFGVGFALAAWVAKRVEQMDAADPEQRQDRAPLTIVTTQSRRPSAPGGPPAGQ